MRKILLFGPEVTDFLNPLAYKLKHLGYVVDLLETRKFPRKNMNLSQYYSTVLDYNKIVAKKLTIISALKYLLKFEFYKTFVNTIIVNCLEGKCEIIRNFKYSLNVQYKKERFSPILNQYDIIHFHSLNLEILSYISFINQDKKIILSFWGSDLFQIWGSDFNQVNSFKKHYEELKAIKRASVITVHSYEMERVVIARFGSAMKDKVVRALFGIKDEIFDMIDENKKSKPDTNFLLKYHIPENKIKITIGYSGDPICNHLQILEEVEKINSITKQRIHLLVPMTYGYFSNEYMEKVKLKLRKTEISNTLFDNFLSLEELMKLRSHSDMMIMMNESDALSISVCESLYADNILISAIWLPYSPLRSENIFFYETDFDKLSETVTYAVNNFEKIKVNFMNNPDKIKRLTALSETYRKWITILDSLS